MIMTLRIWRQTKPSPNILWSTLYQILCSTSCIPNCPNDLLIKTQLNIINMSIITAPQYMIKTLIQIMRKTNAFSLIFCQSPLNQKEVQKSNRKCSLLNLLISSLQKEKGKLWGSYIRKRKFVHYSQPKEGVVQMKRNFTGQDS